MKFSVYIISFLVLFSSCTKDEVNKVPDDIAIQNYIWKGLNLYYLWQADVPDLDDSRFRNQQDLNAFLYTKPNPDDLFQDLLNKPIKHFPAGLAIDRFSVIYSDSDILEGILSGTTLNNGMDFEIRRITAGQDALFGWVRYVLPNSDAAIKNVVRGMIFTGIDGQNLTVANYSDLIKQNNYTINLADYDNGNFTPNGQSISLTGSVISENPVYINKVIESGTKRIGYLMYNGFYSNYESQLNNAFSNLKSQNITHFVLDLRYNSGGSIATATRLASMITGQFAGQVFAKQQWNSKVQDYYQSTNPGNLTDYFTNTINSGAVINSLNLSKIYILTSSRTASASELIINGLKPYINVVQIGDVTVGKNVGSITLYDSPNFAKSGKNPNHKYAMQPLVVRTLNKVGFGDYVNGLEPTISFIENLGNLGVLGETSDPLLNATINYIETGNRMIQPQQKNYETLIDRKSMNEIGTDMYLERLPVLK